MTGFKLLGEDKNTALYSTSLQQTLLPSVSLAARLSVASGWLPRGRNVSDTIGWKDLVASFWGGWGIKQLTPLLLAPEHELFSGTKVKTPGC